MSSLVPELDFLKFILEVLQRHTDLASRNFCLLCCRLTEPTTDLKKLIYGEMDCLDGVSLDISVWKGGHLRL